MLAIRGGTPLRDVIKYPWPTWPVWDDRELKRLSQILDSGIWSYNGPSEKECLSLLEEYFKGSRALLAANGTVTLQMALEALDIGYGDEVIVPGLTWQATAAAVLDVNAIPILVDIDPETWCIDPAAFENAITERTKAVIPVHLYGCTADMDAIMEIAGRHDLYVIEDASHKHGAEWREKKVGTIGDIGSFSLQLSKVLTCGEGGFLLTRKDRLWERLEALRNCGRRSKNIISDVSGGQYGVEGNLIQSGNYRITDFQAGVLIEQFKKLDEQNTRREKNARYLDSLISDCISIAPMKQDIRETKKTHFNYTFRYAPDVLGIPSTVFRQALAAEVGFPVDSCYQPLNDCSLYRPLTKRRYDISQEHVERINPSRFNLPVCKDVYENSSVTFHHKILLGTLTDMEIIADSCKKIVACKHELKQLIRSSSL